MQMPRQDNEASGFWGGFSLLEVLVALMIFAVAAVMLGSAYMNVLNSYVVMGKGTESLQDIAFARMELLTQPDLTTAQKGDEFDTPVTDPSKPKAHVAWTADIEPAGTTDLFNVILTCVVRTDDPTTQPRTVTQSFTLLRPTWSDPTDQTKLRQAATQRIAVLQGRAQQ
jgi:general secretion pathway protein I